MRQVAVEPAWARLYRRVELDAPFHRGKRTLLRMLRALPARRGRPFAWRVHNGALVAVSPVEGLAFAETVGWSCFLRGVWEPHVERCLRTLLRPGDTALDVGANLGYFSAVMAQAVGRWGRVVAFEPVGPTFERLRLLRELNGFDQLTPLRLALGAEHGTLELAYDPQVAGSASAHAAGSEPVTERVEVARLDDLVAAGTVPPPDVVKIDVEGHELEVLTGGAETLGSARPTIVLEFNVDRASHAGWTLGDLERLLRELGPYRLSLVEEDGVRPVDVASLHLGPGSYVDLLAEASA